MIEWTMRSSILYLRFSILSVVFVDPGDVRHADAKDYGFRGRIFRLRLDLRGVRPTFEHVRQDALALSYVLYLFIEAESEHAAPMGVVFDLVHLQTSVRVVAQNVDFVAGRRLHIDAIVIEKIMNRHDIGFAVIAATEPSRPVSA